MLNRDVKSAVLRGDHKYFSRSNFKMVSIKQSEFLEVVSAFVKNSKPNLPFANTFSEIFDKLLFFSDYSNLNYLQSLIKRAYMLGQNEMFDELVFLSESLANVYVSSYQKGMDVTMSARNLIEKSIKMLTDVDLGTFYVTSDGATNFIRLNSSPFYTIDDGLHRIVPEYVINDFVFDEMFAHFSEINKLYSLKKYAFHLLSYSHTLGDICSLDCVLQDRNLEGAKSRISNILSKNLSVVFSYEDRNVMKGDPNYTSPFLLNIAYLLTSVNRTSFFRLDTYLDSISVLKLICERVSSSELNINDVISLLSFKSGQIWEGEKLKEYLETFYVRDLQEMISSERRLT